MKREITIKPAEGGKDSELFCEDLNKVFAKFITNNNWEYNWVIKDREYILFVKGKDLKTLDIFSGGFRLQRVPPTEKKNRTHTSSLIVSVINPEKYNISHSIDENDFKIEWFSGTGSGGQHRNRHKNSCRMTYLPLNITETCQSRSRQQNLEICQKALYKRIEEYYLGNISKAYSNEKSELFGSGQRGDKILTIQFQNNRVTHHLTNKVCRVKDFMNGKLELLY